MKGYIVARHNYIYKTEKAKLTWHEQMFKSESEAMNFIEEECKKQCDYYNSAYNRGSFCCQKYGRKEDYICRIVKCIKDKNEFHIMTGYMIVDVEV